ncbi:hypothetical protein NDU88_006761 [Pleurodeles waltl]|uniref:Helix-turn-helix domain-containing protein n=1 Tax=Pleurodeles waltl TaxID=8319 RepID=A0AAV7QJQ7_PLEWA|nr:hypothetical protein NDU88_006761 [Pleurodeles waltl]
MGSTFAPSLAYVDHFERQVVVHDDNLFLQQIKLWKRYIDDILLVWTGTREEALTFSNWLNADDPFLNFTMTIGDNRLVFLDLLIYENDGALATEVYYKPKDRNNLLQFQSFHPRSLKENLPVGQYLRLRRNCSTLTDYRKHADKLAIKLQTKDYPTHLVKKAYKRAHNNNRDQLLQPRAKKPDMEQIVCVTTFNPLSNKIQRIIKEEWKILTSGGLPFQQPLHAWELHFPAAPGGTRHFRAPYFGRRLPAPASLGTHLPSAGAFSQQWHTLPRQPY